MIASLCLLSVRRSAEQCLAVSCTWVLTWEQVGIDKRPQQTATNYETDDPDQHNVIKRSTMVALEGPLSHSVAASLLKVSSSCTVDCQLLLAPRGSSECFVMFHCHRCSHCFCISHLFLLIDISNDKSSKQGDER
jgi:hypothetical protein